MYMYYGIEPGMRIHSMPASGEWFDVDRGEWFRIRGTMGGRVERVNGPVATVMTDGGRRIKTATATLISYAR